MRRHQIPVTMKAREMRLWSADFAKQCRDWVDVKLA